MTIHRTKGIVRAELRDAARQVHRRARDNADRDELLDALGLTGVAP